MKLSRTALLYAKVVLLQYCICCLRHFSFRGETEYLALSDYLQDFKMKFKQRLQREPQYNSSTPSPVLRLLSLMKQLHYDNETASSVSLG